MVNKDRTGHESHAVIILSGTMVFNSFVILAAVLSLFYLTIGHRISAFLVDPRFHAARNIGALLYALLVLKMNYVLLKKIGYQNIIQEFSGESPRQRRLGNVLVACYEIGTFVLLFVSMTFPL